MPITHLQERLILSRAIIDLIKVSSAYRADRNHFGANPGELLVAYSTLLGTLEGHPMNASKIAEAAGVARTTAKRHLRALEEIGLVERQGSQFVLSEAVLNSPAITDMVATLSTIISTAAVALSRLDTKAIASK